MFLAPILIILLFMQSLKHDDSSDRSPIYLKASVVEFEPHPASLEDLRKNPYEYLGQNVALMKKFIELAVTQKSDIIVFPEYALNHMSASELSLEDGLAMAQLFPRIVPESSSLCAQKSLPTTQRHLQTISCYALKYKVIIIVNLITTEDRISKGKSNQTLKRVFYNTNLAFDRDGRIVARYRKFHLYKEPLISPPNKMDVSLFETDFGVRIGMMTCFDILYEEPLRSLQIANVDVIVFPTLWFNELPFLTGLGFHSGVARRSEVDILSACYYYPEAGVTGSGIYSFEEGIVASTWNEKPKTISGTLWIKDNITNNRYTHWNKGFPHFYQEDLSSYEFERVNFRKNFLQINRKGVNCSIKYSTSTSRSLNGTSRDGYMLIGKKGVRTFGGQYKGGIQVCGLVYCQSLEDRSSCGVYGEELGGNIEFRGVELRGLFDERVVPTPISLNFNYTSISGIEYGMHNPSDYFITIKNSTNNIFSLGLYGRIYSLDSSNCTLNK